MRWRGRLLIISGFRDDVMAALARERLADPRVGIAEIAFELGFSEVSSLYRAFRRWEGVSPGKYRKSVLGG